MNYTTFNLDNLMNTFFKSKIEQIYLKNNKDE